MLFWLGLVAGVIIGWVIEWVIDWQFWRNDVTVISDGEGHLRKELEIARLEIRQLQNQIRQQTDSPITHSPTVATSSTQGQTQDRLQDIEGIGQVYASKLYAAGITTFAALHDTSIDRLTEIINPQEWQTIDFDAWIRQARALAQNADRGK